MSLNLSQPILYLITPGAIAETTTSADEEFQEILHQVSAAVAGGIQLIQLREKNLTARVLFELTERVMEIVCGTATKVLVNDRADIAAGAGAENIRRGISQGRRLPGGRGQRLANGPRIRPSHERPHSGCRVPGPGDSLASVALKPLPHSPTAPSQFFASKKSSPR